MTLFSEKGLFYGALTIGIVVLANAFGNQIKTAISPRKSEDELIRKYLLNENPLYGYNRPKLWIHSVYAYNARKWKSFGSRSSTDLNQDYLHATIKSLIASLWNPNAFLAVALLVHDLMCVGLNKRASAQSDSALCHAFNFKYAIARLL